MLQRLLAILLLLVAGLVCTPSPRAADLIKVPTAWMPELDAFPIWYAKQQGWDKLAGLDIQIYAFESGADALRAFPAKGWVFGGIGAVPAMIGCVRYNMSIIGFANDEAAGNAIMVRKDSPILKHKGENPVFPEVYGNAETVRGKSVLCTRISSADYTLKLWLKSVGLENKDINFKNMGQAQALAAFDYNIGDVVVLWAPFTYVGENHGWKTVATTQLLGDHLPIALVANSAYAAQYPNITASFLSLYTRGIKWLQTAPAEQVIKEVKRFYLEWAGVDYSLNMLQLHPGIKAFFDLDTQKHLFAVNKDKCIAKDWMNKLADFYHEAGSISDTEHFWLKTRPYLTGKYLDRVSEDKTLPK